MYFWYDSNVNPPAKLFNKCPFYCDKIFVITGVSQTLIHFVRPIASLHV